MWMELGAKSNLKKKLSLYVKIFFKQDVSLKVNITFSRTEVWC